MKKAVYLTVVVMVLAAGSLQAGLISHYEFQGDLLNSVIGGGDGTGVGGAEAVCPDPNNAPYPLTWPTVCKADLTFNKWIHVGYPGILYNPVISQKLSIAMWINSENPDYAQLFGRRYEWRMYVQEGKAAFGALTAVGDGVSLVGSAIVADGNWHHIVATYNGATGEVILYVDGQQDAYLVQTSPLVAIESSLRTAIGAIAGDTTSGSSIFEGYMDDIRVYDEILTSTQIQELYEFTTETFCMNPSAFDFSGNCQVGVEDLAIFLQGWLDSGLTE